MSTPGFCLCQSLWMANCYFAHNFLRFPALLPFFNASSGRPFDPLHRYPGPLARTRRCPLLLKHQLLIVNRSRQRTPNLRSSDRILAGLLALLVRPTRLLRSAIVPKPSTLLAIHKAMSKQKYRMLFSSKRRRKPGPKGPSADLVHAVVEMKQRNPVGGEFLKSRGDGCLIES